MATLGVLRHAARRRLVVSTPLMLSPLTRLQSTVSHSHPLPTAPTSPPPPPLARLPTAALVRSLLLHALTASPTLFRLCSKIMLRTADSIDRIPPLRWVVDKTFYAHFCAGATSAEITRTVASLRALGYTGVILAHAREAAGSSAAAPETAAEADIAAWLDSALKTISLTTAGDFVALKLTGAGAAVIPLLRAERACTEIPSLAAALDAICVAAREHGVALLLDAEQAALQPGVDRWALHMMRAHNPQGRPPAVFNTYQMYLKRAAHTLREHAARADREGWRLGVKLVRGAYLHSDPRHLIHDCKAHTDAAYDAAAADIIARGIDAVIASHNRASVERALRLREDAAADSAAVLVFAQLMGMADELSQALVGRVSVLKYTIWGSTGECLKYLLRRVEENSDAATRSEESRRAVVAELRRRCGL